MIEPARARPTLLEAIKIVEALAREGKLTTEDQELPQAYRDDLAKLPPVSSQER